MSGESTREDGVNPRQEDSMFLHEARHMLAAAMRDGTLLN
jgi:hypothetical protein